MPQPILLAERIGKDFEIKVINKAKANDTFTIFSPGLENEESSNKKFRVKTHGEAESFSETNNEKGGIKLPISHDIIPEMNLKKINIDTINSNLKFWDHQY